MKEGIIPKYFIFAALSITIGLLSVNLKFALTKDLLVSLLSMLHYYSSLLNTKANDSCCCKKSDGLMPWLRSS